MHRKNGNLIKNYIYLLSGEGSTAQMLESEPLPNADSKFEAIISELMKNVSNLQASLVQYNYCILIVFVYYTV